MIEGIFITELKILLSESGSVMHALRDGDSGYNEFGEIYFSTINKNAIKAWKLHKKMTLNLVVPIGKVLFCFLDLREDSKTYNNSTKILLSQNPYCRLTVAPNIWFGFKGIGEGFNLVTNIADMKHDDNEVLHQDKNKIEIDWDEDNNILNEF